MAARLKKDWVPGGGIDCPEEDCNYNFNYVSSAERHLAGKRHKLSGDELKDRMDPIRKKAEAMREEAAIQQKGGVSDKDSKLEVVHQAEVAPMYFGTRSETKMVTEVLVKSQAEVLVEGEQAVGDEGNQGNVLGEERDQAAIEHEGNQQEVSDKADVLGEEGEQASDDNPTADVEQTGRSEYFL